MAETVVPGLEQRLKAHLLGEVNFDAYTRGRYATDASPRRCALSRRSSPGTTVSAIVDPSACYRRGSDLQHALIRRQNQRH